MRDRDDMGWREEGWHDRSWRDEDDERPDRGRMYEQSTQTGGYGQQGWQGGYSHPSPGQVGQQQDYRQQQRYGQGGHRGRIAEGQTGYSQTGYGQPGYRETGHGDPGWRQTGFGPVEPAPPWAGRPYSSGGGEGRFGWGEGRFRGRGPKGYVRSDERIREDVSDRLSDDSWIDASDVDVQVMAAVVTLEGSVPDRDQKRRAEDVAADVSGVQDVTNHLRVRREGEGVVEKIGDALTGTTPEKTTSRR